MQPSVASNLQHLSEFKPPSDNSQSPLSLCQGKDISQNSKDLPLSSPIPEHILPALSGSLGPSNDTFSANAETAAVTSEFGWILEVSGSRVWIFGLEYRQELSSWLYLDRKAFLALVSAQCLKAMEHITLWGNPSGVTANWKGGQGTEPTLLCLHPVGSSDLDIVAGSWDF